jgi:hypothetical protein
MSALSVLRIKYSRHILRGMREGFNPVPDFGTWLALRMRIIRN